MTPETNVQPKTGKRGRPKGSKNISSSDGKVNTLLKELATLEKQRTKIRRKLAVYFSR